ncbi:hypothetical protein AG1IA_04944 [Rhizoctonia solani AG-1 IA]|uniref:Uncharacterized protein n=1 Tax=Thanatephorus cucumeris (strain AG1-IA) TaxID=983506 RepID=L8WSB2_THACA|nr:hypothetical protein AG1IA_04944 [Rhizoctonia solani AG-1 IA]
MIWEKQSRKRRASRFVWAKHRYRNPTWRGWTLIGCGGEMWDLRADTLSSSEAAELLEDLGVEQDTSEHVELEKSELCVKAKGRK